MKLPFRLTRFTLVTLLIVFALLGAYVASLTYQYQVIVRGILGFAVLCLIALYSTALRVDGSIDALVSRATISDFIWVFLMAGLAYWATGQIIDSIRLLISP